MWKCSLATAAAAAAAVVPQPPFRNVIPRAHIRMYSPNPGYVHDNRAWGLHTTGRGALVFLAVSIAQQCASIPTVAIRQSPRGCLLCLKWHRREADSVHLEHSKKLDNVVYWRAAMAECIAHCVGTVLGLASYVQRLRGGSSGQAAWDALFGVKQQLQAPVSPRSCSRSVPARAARRPSPPISQRPSPLHCCSPNHPRQSQRRCLACFARAPQHRVPSLCHRSRPLSHGRRRSSSRWRRLRRTRRQRIRWQHRRSPSRSASCAGEQLAVLHDHGRGTGAEALLRKCVRAAEAQATRAVRLVVELRLELDLGRTSRHLGTRLTCADRARLRRRCAWRTRGWRRSSPQ